MSVQTIAIICAILGGVFSVAYLALGAMGIRSLGGIRDSVRRQR